MRSRPDPELLEAVADGDRAALQELYRRHARWLLVRLRRRTSDDGVAEEAVQDAFVKVWRRADSYRGEGDVGAWLWRIGVRCMLDLVRKRVPTPADVVARNRETVESAEERVLLGLEHEDVGAALERLSPEFRAVLQATVVDGLSTREASRLLGIPVGTVKSRAMRARAQLREEMA